VSRRHIASACVAGALWGLAATPAIAQEDSRIGARALGYAGVEAYQAGDYQTAEQKLNRAFMLLPAPSLGLWSARALVKVGALVEASRRYLAVSQLPLSAGDPAVQREAKADAEREHAELQRRIPSVKIELRGAGWEDVQVMVDGTPVELGAFDGRVAINPGQHLIEGRRSAAKGQQPAVVRARVSVTEAEHIAALLDFGTTAPVDLGLTKRPGAPTAGELDTDAGAAWRTGGWIAVGVGGSALLFSGVAGLIAYGQLDEFDCSADPCRSSSADDIDTYNGLRTFSTIGYIAGGLIAGAGAWILLEHREPEATFSVGLGPGSATLRARF
jgi:uncharacterized membrane protein